MSDEKNTISITYINSLNEAFPIELSLQNQLNNLMEVIRENDYEDWGDCDGRSWCRTCHVSIDRNTQDSIFEEEKHALSLLLTRTDSSRLACQIDIDRKLDGATLRYSGDN